MVDALRQRPISRKARFAAMGIWYDDQRANASDKELVTVMARLVISLIVLDQIR